MKWRVKLLQLRLKLLQPDKLSARQLTRKRGQRLTLSFNMLSRPAPWLWMLKSAQEALKSAQEGQAVGERILNDLLLPQSGGMPSHVLCVLIVVIEFYHF